MAARGRAGALIAVMISCERSTVFDWKIFEWARMRALPHLTVNLYMMNEGRFIVQRHGGSDLFVAQVKCD